MAAQPSEWANSAALNALLKYRPQREGLNDLRRQAQERFAAAVRAGISEGRLESQAATGAIAPTKQIYSNSRADAGRSQALLASALSQLPAGSPFALAAANEGAAGNERTDQAEARSLSGLQDKAVAAAETPAFTRQAATAALLKELTSIRAKGQSLDAAEGADTQAEIDAQRKEAHKDRLTERGQNITRQGQESAAASSREHDRTSERNTKESNQVKREIAEEKGEISLQIHPNGKNGLASVKEQRKALGLFSSIKDEAKALQEQGFSRSAIIHALTSPVPDRSKEDPEGNHETVKGHPGYEPNAVMSAALDAAEFGGLSRATEKRLRGEYLDPRRFGKPYHAGHAGVERPGR